MHCPASSHETVVAEATTTVDGVWTWVAAAHKYLGEAEVVRMAVTWSSRRGSNQLSRS